ncbi:MAG: hypothetical protein H6555_06940 [Lewinellaceae bacterium]|nr:hypothetical protein [Lewinellaceae bacterium]
MNTLGQVVYTKTLDRAIQGEQVIPIQLATGDGQPLFIALSNQQGMLVKRLLVLNRDK